MEPPNESDVVRHQRAILNNIRGGPGIPLAGLDEQRGELMRVLERTVVHGESNSLLLLGPHGAGKSALLTSVLRDIDAFPAKPAYRVLKLHGLVHADEKAAFRDLAAQLSLADAYEAQSFSSNADALAYLLRTLRSGSDESTPLVVVLDAFDEFTLHPRQTLLYTLLDAVQGQQNAMAVIGMSTRLDVVSNLEKRVRSRFSHRVQVVSPIATRDAYLAAAAALLDHDAVTEDPAFTEIAETVFTLTASLHDLAAIATPATFHLSPTSPSLSLTHLTAAFNEWLRLNAPSTHWLTYLHLALLAASRVLASRGRPAATFEMLYDAYADFSRRQAVGAAPLAVRRPVAFHAFGELVVHGFLAVTSGGSGGGAAGTGFLREFTVVTLAVPPRVWPRGMAPGLTDVSALLVPKGALNLGTTGEAMILVQGNESAVLDFGIPWALNSTAAALPRTARSENSSTAPPPTFRPLNWTLGAAGSGARLLPHSGQDLRGLGNAVYLFGGIFLFALYQQNDIPKE
ncbi:origin recognition complex subunit 4 [Blastocladiella emersonii ATCC 22665]|nr:origin recognition complex subunit 4 [Blastocladiella emersonii ATCC 22665]